MIYQTHLRPRRLLHVELLLLPLLRYLLLRLFLLQLLGLLDNHHLLQVNQEVLDQFHLLVILRKHSQQRMFFHLRLKVSVVLPREQRFQLLQPFQLHPKPTPVSNKYAPAVTSDALQPPSSGFASPTLNSSPRLAKNPYAPSVTEQLPPKISYATPPAHHLANNGPSTPSYAPPKNPYAVPPSTSVPHAGIAPPPPPPKLGSAAPPPPQPFGSSMSMPVQPAFNGVPPPPPPVGRAVSTCSC